MLLDTQTVAERLGIRAKTLENWRVIGRGPPFRKLGASVRYDENEVTEWLDGQRRTSTSDSGQGQGRLIHPASSDQPHTVGQEAA